MRSVEVKMLKHGNQRQIKYQTVKQFQCILECRQEKDKIQFSR